MHWDRVFAGDLWPVAQRFQPFQPPFFHSRGFTPLFELFHGIRATGLLLHAHREHLTGLEIPRGTAGNRQHHAAAHIGHHGGELAEGVVAHLFKITVPNQRCFNSGHRIPQLCEGDWLTVIQLLAVWSRHRDRGGLVHALIKKQCQQRGQHTRVVLMKGVAKTSKHRSHVFSCFDVLPFNVVNPRCYLNIW